MRHRELLTLLTVGLPEPLAPASHIDATEAATGRQAIAALRMMRFDLLLVGHQMSDMDVWSLMGRVRMGWPSQPWALVSERDGAAEEVRARALGALCVFNRTPESDELTLLSDALRARRVAPQPVEDETVTASKAS